MLSRYREGRVWWKFDVEKFRRPENPLGRLLIPFLCSLSSQQQKKAKTRWRGRFSNEWNDTLIDYYY